MRDRIKEVRKILNLTQKEFGGRIGVKGNTIAQYELGRNKPVDSVLSLICREFNVNEEWLRTGTGEMFYATSSDELDKLALKYNLTHQDYIFIEHLLKDVNARTSIENFCMNFANAILTDNISEDTKTVKKNIKKKITSMHKDPISGYT